VKADLLASEAIELVGDGGSRAILGIAGSPGAGKSTLVDLLLERVAAAKGADWVARVPMDGFHLADAQLDRIGARGRKGAPDTFDAAGYAHLLERVKREVDEPVYVPGFDRTLEQPFAAALVVLASVRLVVTEGNYLLLDDPDWARARRSMDAVWFVASDEGERIARLVARHIDRVRRSIDPDGRHHLVAHRVDHAHRVAVRVDRIDFVACRIGRNAHWPPSHGNHAVLSQIHHIQYRDGIAAAVGHVRKLAIVLRIRRKVLFAAAIQRQ